MTDQSHNFPQSEQLDPIITLMGPMPDDELELRRKLRQASQVATYIPHETESPLARTLAWEVCTLALQWQFAPATVQELEKVTQLARRILICANSAMLLEAGV